MFANQGENVALGRNYRFPVAFSDAFPWGLLAVSDVTAATERQSAEDRARGREPRQRVDAATGSPVWNLTVTDPMPARAREAAVTVELLSEDQPVLPAPVSGLEMSVRQVELTGLTAEPRLGGQGEFRYLTYVYRADGVRGGGAGSSSAGTGPAPASTGSTSGESSKSGGK